MHFNAKIVNFKTAGKREVCIGYWPNFQLPVKCIFLILLIDEDPSSSVVLLNTAECNRRHVCSHDRPHDR